MMEYVIIALMVIVLFLLYLLNGYSSRPNPKQLTIDELEKIKRQNEGFKNIMNYTVEQAMERRLKNDN